MDRKIKRQNERLLNSVKRKAKKDMEEWMLSLPELPSEGEVKAFQAGYIAGISRGSQENERL
jgi:hypothetical protein